MLSTSMLRGAINALTKLRVPGHGGVEEMTGISLPQALSRTARMGTTIAIIFSLSVWGEHDGDTVWIVAFDFG